MSTSSSVSATRSDLTWRTGLQWISAAAAIEIALHAFIVTEPVVPLIAAVVWVAAGFFWTRRGGQGGPVLIAILATLEVVATVFFPEEFGENIATWILIVHLVVMIAALVAAVMTLARPRPGSGREER